MSRKLDTYVKAPVEVKEYAIDYSKWLESGETISSVDREIKAKGFVDPAVSSLAINDYGANTAGTGVTYKVEDGDDGETYEVFITITTSAGQVKEDLVVFRVKALG